MRLRGFAACSRLSASSACSGWDTSRGGTGGRGDRKSTRLNSSHRTSSYAVFCLKKKMGQRTDPRRSHAQPAACRRHLRGLLLPTRRAAAGKSPGRECEPRTGHRLHFERAVPGSRVSRLADGPNAGGTDQQRRQGRQSFWKGLIFFHDRIGGRRDSVSIFFFNVSPPTEIYTLSLHDALPI